MLQKHGWILYDVCSKNKKPVKCIINTLHPSVSTCLLAEEASWSERLVMFKGLRKGKFKGGSVVLILVPLESPAPNIQLWGGGWKVCLMFEWILMQNWPLFNRTPRSLSSLLDVLFSAYSHYLTTVLHFVVFLMHNTVDFNSLFSFLTFWGENSTALLDCSMPGLWLTEIYLRHF